MLNGTTTDGSGNFIARRTRDPIRDRLSYSFGRGFGIYHPAFGIAGRGGFTFGSEKKTCDPGTAPRIRPRLLPGDALQRRLSERDRRDQRGRHLPG